MLEDTTKQNEVVEVKNNELTTESVLSKIENIQDSNDLKEAINLFNLSITKKDMLRAMQQDELLDIIIKQAGDRLRKRPDELSTRDLLDYMNAFQNNLSKTQDAVIENSPTIQINDNKKVIVNVENVAGLNRDSSENVLDAIKDIIKELNSETSLNDLLDSVKTIDVENNNEGE